MSEKMYCPLVTQAEFPCSKEQCPWWLSDYQNDNYECAMLSIARSLAKIAGRE